MSKPEALRLADVTRLSRHHEWHLQVDAELRRLHAANEQLATEVANRNRRALDGDEAVFALANVHACYEKLEAQRDALLEALKQIEPILARMYGIQAADLPPMQAVRAAIAKAEDTR